MSNPGAKIHAARARKFKGELDAIEKLLDDAKIPAAETTADRVKLALDSRQNALELIDEREWEAAAP